MPGASLFFGKLRKGKKLRLGDDADLETKVDMLIEEKADAEDVVELRSDVDRIEDKLAEIARVDAARPDIMEMADKIQVLEILTERTEKEVSQVSRDLRRRVEEDEFHKLADEILWIQRDMGLLRRQLQEKVGPENMEFLIDSIRMIRTQITGVERLAQKKAEGEKVNEHNAALIDMQRTLEDFHVRIEEIHQPPPGKAEAEEPVSPQSPASPKSPAPKGKAQAKRGAKAKR